MMVLVATTTEGHRVAFKIDVPPSAEDLHHVEAIQEMPGLEACTWTGQENLR